ncbi:MAG: hypothetical protein VYB55_00440, partial [Bacteroidota bacterium]|nr:hypothetical protein [Bacteroidota bacterium]
MKRRKFIKNLGLGTAATIGVPYLLPSGRLFAATGYRRANHVVFCLFAGGVRNLESVHKSHGNLMPRTLKGEETRTLLGIDSINNDEINGPTLQEQGTLYKEFRFKQGSTGHYGAHATAMTGVYTGNVNINANPENPTIFELYRKHNSPSMSAKNAWWVSDSEGLYANLNYSSHPGYGANYGANYVRPSSFTDGLGHDSLGDPKEYNPEVVDKIKSIRGFCDANFSSQYSGVANSIEHDDEADKIEIENFINKCMDEANMGDFSNPSTWNWDLTSSSFNGDMKAVH